MRIEWVVKNNAGRVVVFFNGWGMNTDAIKHLDSESDVVVIYDYRSLECDGGLPDLSGYHQIYIVAWSMGVWAAANILSRWDICPVAKIALNGTGHPVDNDYGIPENIYLLTEKGMDEKGREKFLSRMFTDRVCMLRFVELNPTRELSELLDELRLIRVQSRESCADILWDRIYISEKDIIFSPVNQLNWWQGKADIRFLSSGHYPFYCFQSWEEILEDKL